MKEKVFKLFKEGKTAKEIAETTGLKLVTVHSQLRENFGTASQKYYNSSVSENEKAGRKKTVDYKKIEKDFVSGAAVIDISKKYGITERHIRRIITKSFGTTSSIRIKELKKEVLFLESIGKSLEKHPNKKILKHIKKVLERKE